MPFGIGSPEIAVLLVFVVAPLATLLVGSYYGARVVSRRAYRR